MLKEIINWFKRVFDFTPVQSVHLIVPPDLIGSADWVQPEVNNISQNWDKYLSLPYGNQYTGTYYEDNCTVYDAIEHIQAILNEYIASNPNDIVTNFLKGYYCKDGWVKLSVRYSSKMAGIKQHFGANIGDVWNSFALHGLVPESVYNDPQYPFTWDEYMSEVPEGIVRYGSYSASFFKIIWTVLQNNNWNVINPDLFRKALITSPISVAGSIGNIIDGIEQWPGLKLYSHARLIIGINNSGQILVLDNYPINNSLKRVLSSSFPVPCAIVAMVKII